MRLIDADKIIFAEIDEVGGEYEPYLGCSKSQIDDLPTVEAIPKADIQKALKEGSIDISKNVLAIVREEYIPKADYENRLKADLVAMLTEIQTEIEELKEEPACCQHFVRGINRSSEVIRQKIDKLKEVEQ